MGLYMAGGPRLDRQSMVNQKELKADREFRAVLTAARTAFYAAQSQHRRPSVEEVDALTRGVSSQRVAKILSSDKFVKEMRKQGIDWIDQKGLTPQQHYALLLITDPSTRKPLDVRLRAAGITMTQYRNWLKNPLFNGMVMQFAEQTIPEHMAQAHNSLLALVDKQNLDAVKFYYAMTGRYNPQSQVERDINSVLVQVVDIIQRAGLDQDKLELIAGELRSLMSGPVPQENRAITEYRSEREDLTDFEDDDSEYTEVIEDNPPAVAASSNDTALPFKAKGFHLGD